jgi:hypothetical protein
LGNTTSIRAERSSRPVISIGRKLRAGIFSAALTGVFGSAAGEASLRRH